MLPQAMPFLKLQVAWMPKYLFASLREVTVVTMISLRDPAKAGEEQCSAACNQLSHIKAEQ